MSKKNKSHGLPRAPEARFWALSLLLYRLRAWLQEKLFALEVFFPGRIGPELWPLSYDTIYCTSDGQSQHNPQTSDARQTLIKGWQVRKGHGGLQRNGANLMGEITKYMGDGGPSTFGFLEDGAAPKLHDTTQYKAEEKLQDLPTCSSDDLISRFFCFLDTHRHPHPPYQNFKQRWQVAENSASEG